MNNTAIQEAFEVLQNKEQYFEKLNKTPPSWRLIVGQLALMAICSFLYGLLMGSYNSLLQAMVTGTKLWLLVILSLAICFPSFYIVQLILGSKIGVKKLLTLLLSGFVMTTIIMVAFAPIVLLFQLSGSSYDFLQLLHVAVFVFAGFFGMRTVLEALKSYFESEGVYPKIGLPIFRIWVLIFAFVSMQLSWNMRPFIGSRDKPFELFRSESQGNFYTNLFRAFEKLGKPDDAKKKKKKLD